MAGRICSSRTARTGRDNAGGRRRSNSFATTSNGTFTNVTRAAGLAVESLRNGHGRRRFRQRRRRGSVRDHPRAEPSVSQQRRASSRMSRRSPACPGRTNSAPAQPGWTTTRTGIWIYSSPTTSSGLSQPTSVARWTEPNKSYCTPESYKGHSARLWRNKGNGTFQDVTKEAGLLDATSKALGVTVLDCESGSWPDLLLANDTQPNRLYINTGKGAFTEKGVLAGIAYSEDGVARAGMGVAAADYDRSGFPSVLITNFSNEMLALYHNEGNGLFVDEAPRSEVGRASLLTLGFGCFFFDYDLDGWLDIFVANGHIEQRHRTHPVEDQVCAASSFVSKRGEGQVPGSHAIRGRRHSPSRGSARGAAYGDFDNDGDLDIVMTTNGWPGRSAPQRWRLQPQPAASACGNPIEP